VGVDGQLRAAAVMTEVGDVFLLSAVAVTLVGYPCGQNKR
jgi:hypothetical protein